MKKRSRSEAEPVSSANDARKEGRQDVAAAEAEDEEEDLVLSSSPDVCRSLTDRYGKSKAPQHRHLIATAAAMKSVLLEEGLPLTPPAYFAAAISSFSDLSSHPDPHHTAAVSSLLSILLSLDSMLLPPSKAKDAAILLSDFFNSNSNAAAALATGTVRSLIKSLGLLLLRLDLEDWTALESPFRTLLLFAVDKRPKVRKCAQDCVEKVFKGLRSARVSKKASKLILCMYKKYVSMAGQLNSADPSDVNISNASSKSEHMEMLYMLNLLTVIVPNISDKVRMNILSDVYKMCYLSLLTGHILKLLDSLVECLQVDALVLESENLFSALTSYISSEKNSIDTVISASTLLKHGLEKLRDAQPNLWLKFLPSIFSALTGYLNSGANTSKLAEDVLKELIKMHISQSVLLNISTSYNDGKEDAPEVIVITSICTVLDKMLATYEIPTENALKVISVFFFRLGGLSYHFMKEILLKLSKKMMDLKEECPIVIHLEQCVGAAVIAMGSEKVLSVIPISLDVDKITCLNTWILPILKKYVIGASLQYFVENIVPLANSVKSFCKRVKKPDNLEGLQSCFLGLWALLPAFCRYPTDTPKSFEGLSKLLVATLKENPSLHETIARAIQELVNGNKKLIKNNQDRNHSDDDLSSIFTANDLNMETFSCLVSQYSKKAAARNMKALACSSMDLFQTLTDVFLDSPPEQRTSLKEAISCLAFVLGSEKIKHIFISSLEKFELLDSISESRKLEDQISDNNINEEETTENEEHGKKRCLVMELASLLVEAADEDLTYIIFNYIKSCLSATDGLCQSEAYYALSRILEEHNWFCSTQLDDLINLLFAVKVPVDSIVMSNRFSCFNCLLVQILTSNIDDMNDKAFLILNEIIVTLKTKKDSRKLAYNLLLKISCTLKNNQSTDLEPGLHKLLNMVVGYLSSSSPHIMSGAISALSLLIYDDASFCIALPNLIPSVLTLLQNKSTEVIKAALGFIKVLVSSLHSSELTKLLTDILNGVLPWSSVSKFHFRSKVGIILEILIRKCGSGSVGAVVPEKYRSFWRTIEGRQKNKNPMLSNLDTAQESRVSVNDGGHKRAHQDLTGPSDKKHHKFIHQRIRRKLQEGMFSTSNKKPNKSDGKAERSQSLKVVPSISSRTSKAQSRNKGKKRKNNLNHKPRGKKATDIEERTDVGSKKFHHASETSKSGLPSKSYKRRRKSENQGSK